jgi:hypothetical protein
VIYNTANVSATGAHWIDYYVVLVSRDNPIRVQWTWRGPKRTVKELELVLTVDGVKVE